MRSVLCPSKPALRQPILYSRSLSCSHLFRAGLHLYNRRPFRYITTWWSRHKEKRHYRTSLPSIPYSWKLPRPEQVMDMSSSSSGASAGSWALAGAILGATATWFILSGTYLSSKSGKGTAKKSWPNDYDVKIHPDSSDSDMMEQIRKMPRVGAEGAEAASSDEDDEDDEDGLGSGAVGELSSFPSHENEECKLVLVVRTDLGMGKGKIAAQCSHATLACYKFLLEHGGPRHPVLRRWENLGQAKIAVQCPGGEDELVTLQALAVSLGLTARIIRDAGRTQIASGSATVLGVGPGPKSVIDQVTGGLKLL